MTSSYWLEEPWEGLRAPTFDGRVDVAVVGGGVTGCACALALAEGGLRVRLYEAGTIASGASGRNGGFALRGGADAYDVSRERIGAESARELWRLTERQLDRMEELAGDALRRVGSLRVAWDESEALDLRSEYEALRADGFDADWLEPYGRFPAALRHPRDGSLDPGRWIRRLAARAAEAGADVWEHAHVESLDELDAEQVVIATDGLTRGLVPTLDDAIRPVRNQVVVTEPLAGDLYRCPHYGRCGWDYWQQLPDGRLVAGGRRDADADAENTSDDALTEPVQRALETLVEELVDRRPAITHRWAGIFGVTADRIPYAGRVPGRDGVWVAAGYSGHGNVLGLACGELVAGAILGRPRPELDLFDPARAL